MIDLLKGRWVQRLGGVTALVLAERSLAALLAGAEGAQVLMAAGPATPPWILLSFAGLLSLRLMLWLVMPGWALGWLAQGLLERR